MSGSPRVLVLGAGSIGTRHAGNLVALGADVSVADVELAKAAATGSRALALDDVASASYDGVVVCTPTRLHREHVRLALDVGRVVLVEKPLTDSVEGLDDLVDAAGERVAVGFNLRMHEPVERFVEVLRSGELGRLLAVRAWFGSHLPDWRPNTDYRAGYSARHTLGGGVLMDAIHELDLLVWCLGPDLEVVGAIVDRVGELEIDVEDTVKALLRRPADGVPVELSLDYLSRRYRRGLEAVGTEATARLDWSRHILEVEDAGGVRAEAMNMPLDTSYEREAAAFLAWIAGGDPLPVDSATGAASVRLAAAIRAAAR